MKKSLISYCNYFAVLFCFVMLISSCKKDVEVLPQIMELTLSESELQINGADTTVVIKVTAPELMEWVLSPNFKSWMTITPASGIGSGEIVVKVSTNPFNVSRSNLITLKAVEKEFPINIKQKDGINTPPSKVNLIEPFNDAKQVSNYPKMQWTASFDANNDKLKYIVYYSKDLSTWIASDTIASTNCFIFNPLDQNAKYSWKVKTIDARGASSESDVYTFTTGVSTVHADGSYWIYDADPTMHGPVPLIFTGDGFVPNDYSEGGYFDQKVDEGIRDFFDTEPYKSLRQYFTVYKVAAHSHERGITRYDLSDLNLIEKINTTFSTRYYGNGYNSTLMRTNCSKVFEYARKIPGITNAVLDNTTVVLITNSNVYSGTCWMESSGKSVSIVPTCDGYQPYTYKMTMAHEAGGHGFGQLADEYLFQNRPINQQEIASLLSWNTDIRNSNIDVTGDKTLIKWKHFFGVPGYESVGAMEGAQYTSGVWKPEYMSCMVNMAPPYNAPSREAIMKRIMKSAGETYTFDKFLKLDVRPTRVQMQKSAQLKPNPWVNHCPPQHID